MGIKVNKLSLILVVKTAASPYPIWKVVQLTGPELNQSSVLARRASRRPMDSHFWRKYIQNSLNLLKNLQETCSLDGQLSISG